jgi:protocatechuate 3,4-dioxygenase beta subunit
MAFDETENTAPPVPEETAERVSMPAEASTAMVRIKGKLVLQEDGTHVAEAKLRFNFIDPDDETELITDENGEFQCAFPSTRLLHSVHIFAGPETIEVVRFLKQWLSEGEHEITLETSRGGTVQGTVVDENAEPVPFAVVKGWCCQAHENQARRYGEELCSPHRTVTADGQGRFRVEHLGASFLLDAEAPGMVCRWRLYGKMKTGQVVEGVTLTLGRQKILRGRVLTPDRSPIAGVKVYAKTVIMRGAYTSTSYPEVHKAYPMTVETITDDRGAFALTPLAPNIGNHQGRPYRIEVSHASYLRWSSSPENLDQELEIVLDEGATLTGVVFDDKGKPLPGARVRAFDSSNGSWVETDEDGCFLIRGLLAEESKEVMVLAPGMAVQMVEHGPIEKHGIHYMEIVLASGLNLAGMVRDPGGNPVPDAHVSIRGDREWYSGDLYMGTWEGLFGKRETRTDDEGRFRFNDLYDGEFTVFVAKMEDPERTMELKTRSGNESMEIVLDALAMRKVVLRGKVTDELTGLPVERFTITPMREVPRKDDMASFSGTPREFNQPDGTYEISGLSEGNFTISATAEGYASVTSQTYKFETGEHSINFLMAQERSIRVRVLNEQGKPVEGAQIQAVVGESLDPPEKSLMSWQIAKPTDAKGETTVNLLPATKLVLWVFPPKKGECQPFPVDLRSEVHETRDLVLETKRTVELDFGFLGTVEDLKSGPMKINDLKEHDRLRSLFEEGRLWIMDVSMTFSIFSLEGRLLKQGSCKLVAKDQWEIVLEPDEVITSTRPFMNMRIPRKPVRIKVEAQGYRTEELTFDPDAPKYKDEDHLFISLWFHKEGN